MLAQVLGILLALVLIGCSSPRLPPKHPDPTCSDEAHAELLTKCAARAAACVAKGGTEEACGVLCDSVANEWQERCQ